MTQDKKQKVDPILKLFFFLILLTGLFTVLYHPVIEPKFPTFAKEYNSLRRVPTGPDFLPLEKKEVATLITGKKSLRATMTSEPLYVLFRANASRKYTFSAKMLDNKESITANLYKGEYPSHQKEVIATTLMANHPVTSLDRSQSEELYQGPPVAHPHDQYEYALLDSGEVYTLEVLHEDKASIGKVVVVSASFKDRGYEVGQVWGAFAGLLVFLYICRIALLLLKIRKMRS